MKKFTALLLAVIMVISVFCFTSCNNSKDSDVVILWRDEDTTQNPNSLLNSMDRAMFTQKLSYKHYGAKYDGTTQLDQAKSAIDGGCKVLAVELVNPLIAQAIVDCAKEKDVSVIFFNSDVPDSVLSSYDKCTLVSSNISTISDVQGELIATYVKDNFKDLDKNEDGKINYSVAGITVAIAAIKKANELLATEDYQAKLGLFKKVNVTLEHSSELDLTKVELIVTEDEAMAAQILKKLQESDYNTDKLKTQFVPIFTVGGDLDYKTPVLLGRPKIDDDLLIKPDDDKNTVKAKNKAIKKLPEIKEYYEKNKFLIDLTTVDESDLEAMIYTTLNVIENGRISGTVTQDNDSIAGAVAKLAKNVIKNKDIFKGVASKVKKDKEPSVVVDGSKVLVRYISHSN